MPTRSLPCITEIISCGYIDFTNVLMLQVQLTAVVGI